MKLLLFFLFSFNVYSATGPSDCGVYDIFGRVEKSKTSPGEFQYVVHGGTVSEYKFNLTDTQEIKLAPYIDRASKIRAKLSKKITDFHGDFESVEKVEDAIPDPGLNDEQPGIFSGIEGVVQMKIALLMVMTLINTTVFAAANNTIIMFGGGGEPAGAEETQFDGSMENLGQFATDSDMDYKTIVNFNGGHSKTERKIEKYFDGAEIVNGFTAESYNKILDDAIKKISTGQIPAGGKMLVFIDSHGSEKRGDETHSVSVSKSAMMDMNAGGSGMVSLDKIKELSAIAEKRNVKLGIIDGSCHSGNSLSLANNKTCVISASGPNHYSYSDFAAIYAKNMKKGKNLEEIFFETTKENKGKGFPMISSPAGMAAQGEIYPYLTPYMYYHDEYRGMALNKIDIYMKNIDSPQLMCRREADFVKLNSVIKLVEDMGAVGKKGAKLFEPVDLSKLRKKIADYKKTQDEYFKKLNQLDLSSYEKKEVIETKAYKGGNNSYTHKELLSTDYNFLIKNKTDLMNDSSADAKKREQAKNLVEFYKECQRVKEKVINSNPQYKSQASIIDGLKTDENAGSKVAFEIMEEANKAYNALYKLKEIDLVEQGKRPPNPCKDFVL